MRRAVVNIGIKASSSYPFSQGNAAFKSGDYPAAIGHYTSAILADGNDPTFPLNRAAAYLKLGKYVYPIICQSCHWVINFRARRNEDAERDCTTVLKLSPNNVKALFRRGQARTGLDYLDGARAGECAISTQKQLIISMPFYRLRQGIRIGVLQCVREAGTCRS
jgi:tetratricopeptide (TPR) repeat protein